MLPLIEVDAFYQLTRPNVVPEWHNFCSENSLRHDMLFIEILLLFSKIGIIGSLMDDFNY